MDKVKAFVNLAARLYPNLRRSLVEVYSSLTVMLVATILSVGIFGKNTLHPYMHLYI